jgi:hypothetical protein
MKAPPCVVVSLTGGLGNQIFQFAAGLQIARQSNRELMLEIEYGKPRLNSSNLPVLFSLLQEDFKIFRFRYKSQLSRSIMNRAMLLSLQESDSAWHSTIKKGAQVFCSMLINIQVFGNIKFDLFIASDLGFELIPVSQNSLFLKGYFQSYRYFDEPMILEYLMNLKPNSESELFDQYYKIANDQKVLMVHIRLGDYLQEANFGIPSKHYYSNAISEMLSFRAFDQIWVVSDQPNLAKEMFEEFLVENIQFIDQEGMLDEHVWQLLRQGAGYVIGNSSFAWWAALLSANVEKLVVCPTPWFRGIREPKDLVPPSWRRRNAYF